MFIKDKSELKPKFRALFEQAEHLIDGGSIDVEVKKHVHKRSNAQNNYYWLICSEVAKFLDEAGLEYGELDYSSDIIHAINKKKTGTKTTTKLSIGEFCEYMTRIIQFWQEKTSFEWMPSELPAMYLANRGYTDDYIRR
jgi:hypothetical protein